MIGPIFGMLDKSSKDKVLKAIAEESARRVKVYKETIVKAFDFKKLSPDDRLAFYEQNLAPIWEQLSSTRPDIAEKIRADWQQLEYRRLNREISAFNPFYPIENKSYSEAFRPGEAPPIA